jgi:hypothetical protein
MTSLKIYLILNRKIFSQLTVCNNIVSETRFMFILYIKKRMSF